MEKAAIGNTPLRQIPEINDMFGLPNLLVKDESANPNGTMKDRRSLRIIEHLKRSKDKNHHLALVTAGNAAMSIQQISNGLNLQITAIVSHQLKPHISLAMEKAGIRVIPTDLDRELHSTDIEHLAKRNQQDKPVDVSTNMHSVYGSIIDELAKARVEADYILAPLGTGEAVYGMAKNNYRSQAYSPHHSAKLLGIRPADSNSFADKLSGPIIPYNHWLDQEFRKEGYEEVTVTEKEIIRTYQAISELLQYDKENGKLSPLLKLEPSSAVPFAALRKLSLKRDAKVVVVNSGQGIF